jgi:hypothetical protein
MDQVHILPSACFCISNAGNPSIRAYGAVEIDCGDGHAFHLALFAKPIELVPQFFSRMSCLGADMIAAF